MSPVTFGFVMRGFMPASSLQALLTPGVKTGTGSIPGRISNDPSLFMRDAAQIIEYPVSEDVALRVAADLPKPGIPSEGFAQARPSASPSQALSDARGGTAWSHLCSLWR